MEVLATIIREMKEVKGIKIGEGEVKMSPFVGDTTGSIGICKQPLETILNLSGCDIDNNWQIHETHSPKWKMKLGK